MASCSWARRSAFSSRRPCQSASGPSPVRDRRSAPASGSAGRGREKAARLLATGVHAQALRRQIDTDRQVEPRCGLVSPSQREVETGTRPVGPGPAMAGQREGRGLAKDRLAQRQRVDVQVLDLDVGQGSRQLWDLRQAERLGRFLLRRKTVERNAAGSDLRDLYRPAQQGCGPDGEAGILDLEPNSILVP